MQPSIQLLPIGSLFELPTGEALLPGAPMGVAKGTAAPGGSESLFTVPFEAMLQAQPDGDGAVPAAPAKNQPAEQTAPKAWAGHVAAPFAPVVAAQEIDDSREPAEPTVENEFQLGAAPTTPAAQAAPDPPAAASTPDSPTPEAAPQERALHAPVTIDDSRAPRMPQLQPRAPQEPIVTPERVWQIGELAHQLRNAASQSTIAAQPPSTTKPGQAAFPAQTDFDARAASAEADGAETRARLDTRPSASPLPREMTGRFMASLDTNDRAPMPEPSIADRAPTHFQTATVAPTETAPPEQPAAPAPAVETGSLVEQIERIGRMMVDRVEGTVRTDGPTVEAQLKLTPEKLGSVRVVLKMQDGGVQATLTAERPETAAMLQQQIGQLREALTRQGLTIERIQVGTQPAPVAVAAMTHGEPTGTTTGDGWGRRPDTGAHPQRQWADERRGSQRQHQPYEEA